MAATWARSSMATTQWPSRSQILTTKKWYNPRASRWEKILTLLTTIKTMIKSILMTSCSIRRSTKSSRGRRMSRHMIPRGIGLRSPFRRSRSWRRRLEGMWRWVMEWSRGTRIAAPTRLICCSAKVSPLRRSCYREPSNIFWTSTKCTRNKCHHRQVCHRAPGLPRVTTTQWTPWRLLLKMGSRCSWWRNRILELHHQLKKEWRCICRNPPTENYWKY